MVVLKKPPTIATTLIIARAALLDICGTLFQLYAAVLAAWTAVA